MAAEQTLKRQYSTRSARSFAARRRAWIASGLTYLGLALFLVFALFPIYWMIVTAFKPDYDLVRKGANPFWFRTAPTFSHFTYLFANTQFATWLLNTLIVALATVAITLLLGVPCAYALARLKFKGADNLGIGIFLTYLVPPAILFLPLLRVVSDLGVVDTKWSLAIVYPTFTLPFCVWLLIGFFKTVPLEVEEAALVDGCNRLGAMVKVVLPLSVAGLLTVAIFALTLALQEFIYALTFVSTGTEKTVVIGVTTDLIRGDVYFWGSLMAGALIAGLPVAVLYNFFLDYFVQGISQGAVK